jgi:hypothetical protein
VYVVDSHNHRGAAWCGCERFDYVVGELEIVGATGGPRGESAQRKRARRGCGECPSTFAPLRSRCVTRFPGEPALPYAGCTADDDSGGVAIRHGGFDHSQLVRAAGQRPLQVHVESVKRSGKVLLLFLRERREERNSGQLIDSEHDCLPTSPACVPLNRGGFACGVEHDHAGMIGRTTMPAHEPSTSKMRAWRIVPASTSLADVQLV